MLCNWKTLEKNSFSSFNTYVHQLKAQKVYRKVFKYVQTIMTL